MANRYLPRAERFWMKVDKSAGCWLWMGACWASGYGQFCDKGRRLLAHRVAFELTCGEIGAGLTLDHLCRNKSCVNPDHLEPVTRGENVRRWAATVTHCPHGHEYTEANTERRGGKRHCRECGRIKDRKRDRRKVA